MSSLHMSFLPRGSQNGNIKTTSCISTIAGTQKQFGSTNSPSSSQGKVSAMNKSVINVRKM